MFIYHYRVKNWFVYSCPRRVILISRSSKSTEVVLYINQEHYRFGRMVQRKQIKIHRNVVKRKKPTLKYIIPVLERIVDNRYIIICSQTTGYDNRGVVLRNWEEKMLVDVGFYE